MSITITATAVGNLSPQSKPYPKPVTNGDFQIIPNPGSNDAGDGVNESTKWTFDFNGDPNFQFFSTSLPLTSALLTLTLQPKDPLITTDTVGIEGLPNISTPVIQSLPVSVLNTVHLQLLGLPGYASNAIHGKLVNGKISMVYQDDAIVSSAKLELTQRLPVFQYAVKFVCGKSEGKVVSPGIYCTAINVHNPTYNTIEFRRKIAIALPHMESGTVSQFVNAKLDPDKACEIDCDDIRHVDPKADFLKGFVVIESDVELDVVAVYTAAGIDKQVETMHTERVMPRRRLLVPVEPPCLKDIPCSRDIPVTPCLKTDIPVIPVGQCFNKVETSPCCNIELILEPPVKCDLDVPPGMGPCCTRERIIDVEPTSGNIPAYKPIGCQAETLVIGRLTNEGRVIPLDLRSGQEFSHIRILTRR